MNNIEQVRESISDASYALTQVGGNVDYVALLTMRERLNRLVDLEYALLTGVESKGEDKEVDVNVGAARADMGTYTYRVVEDAIRSADIERYYEKGPRYLTITKMDGSKHSYRFAE